MSKRRKFAIAAFCIGVVAVFAFLNHESEPRHAGKTLSQWLSIYRTYGKSKEAEAAMPAVRAIGTNALPHLVKWIQFEPPAWRVFLHAIAPSKIRDNKSFRSFILGPAGKRAEYGIAGFEILGTNGVAVVPQLESLSKSTNAPGTVLRTFSALISIGEPSLPVLERTLADKNQILRNQIPYWLNYMARRDGPTAYLPLMRQALTNDDRTIRDNAASLVQGMENK